MASEVRSIPHEAGVAHIPIRSEDRGPRAECSATGGSRSGNSGVNGSWSGGAGECEQIGICLREADAAGSQTKTAS
jgi:hypothetical protein